MVKRLKKAPLVEVIWKIQFDPQETISSLIHGVLYSELKRKYQQIAVRRLPVADLTDSVTRADPNLIDIPRYVLFREEYQILWQVGMGILTLNCRKPYVGWKSFKEEIEVLCDIVAKNDLITFPAFCSFRYVNLIERDFNGEDRSFD